MSNNIENNLRSRNCDISDIGNIIDGNDIIGRNEVKASLMKVPSKESMNKTIKVKKKSRSKFYDERSEQFKCPECGQLFELCDDVSKHVWYEHKFKVESATKKGSQQGPSTKKTRKGKPKKWHPNADGRYECPFCGKSYKNVHSASCHVWTDHKRGKKGLKEQDKATPSMTFDSLSSTSIWKWLQMLPIEFVQTMDPEKLKELIIEKKREEGKTNVAKS